MSACAQLGRPLRLPTATQLGIAAGARRGSPPAPARRAGRRRPPAGAGRPAGSAGRDRPAPRRRYGRCRRRASRRRAASSSAKAARRAPASSPLSASRAAGPIDQAAPEGATLARVADQRIGLGAEGPATRPARAPNRSGSDRLDAAAQAGRQGRRGAAGRDRHHDVVAIDDGRQDEVAERRPVGDVDRHAGGAGGVLGGDVAASARRSRRRPRRRPSGRRHRGDRGGRSSAPAERASVGAPVGDGALAHDHDPAADEIEEQRQVLHDGRPGSGRTGADDSLRNAACAGLPSAIFSIWRVIAHQP